MDGPRPLSDYELWNYLDGGLTWPARIRIVATGALDWRLARRIGILSLLNRHIWNVERSVLYEPIPERLRRVLADAVCDTEPGPEHGIFLSAQQAWFAIALLAAGCLAWWAF